MIQSETTFLIFWIFVWAILFHLKLSLYRTNFLVFCKLEIIVLLYVYLLKDCQRNVHKRCQGNVPNDCGVDAKKMADLITKEIDKTPDKLQRVSKTAIWVCFIHFKMIFFHWCLFWNKNLKIKLKVFMICYMILLVFRMSYWIFSGTCDISISKNVRNLNFNHHLQCTFFSWTGM